MVATSHEPPTYASKALSGYPTNVTNILNKVPPPPHEPPTYASKALSGYPTNVSNILNKAPPPPPQVNRELMLALPESCQFTIDRLEDGSGDCHPAPKYPRDGPPKSLIISSLKNNPSH